MSINDWPENKLKDCVDLLAGYAFKSNFFTDDRGDIPLVKGSNVQQGYIDWENCKRWPRSKTDIKNIDKYWLQEGDVVLAMDRPWVPAGLKWGWIKKNSPKPLLVQRVARLRGIKNLETNFLRYLIASPQFTNYIKPIVTGVNVPHISGDQVLNYSFKRPPLPTQRKIASILSAYDDMIENNLRRIKILEEMSQNLYREWFVKFRFPGHEKTRFVDSELGRIPEGWEVKSIESIIKRLPSGKKYSQKTAELDGKIPVLDQGKSGIIGYHNQKPGVYASEDEPIIVFANHTCYQRIVMFDFSVIQNVLPFVPNPNNQRNIYWLHYATKDLVTFNDYKGHWPEFMSKVVPFPIKKITDKFGELINPIESLKFKFMKSNELLTKTRDLLLPKLISGEIDVSEMDIETQQEEVPA